MGISGIDIEDDPQEYGGNVKDGNDNISVPQVKNIEGKLDIENDYTEVFHMLDHSGNRYLNHSTSVTITGVSPTSENVENEMTFCNVFLK